MSPEYSPLEILQCFLGQPLVTTCSESTTAVFALFQTVADTVPAYQDFLRTHDIKAEAVTTMEAFRQLPLMTKENYIQRYTLAERCRGGSLHGCDIVAVSSGSTGQPTVWPRALEHEVEVAVRFEQIFRDAFRAHERRTLAVVCFPMGTWVGGIFTLNCCRLLTLKGYAITSVAPGNQPAEIFRVVQTLGSQFEQVVLLGYPPFLKTVIDQGLAQGIDWPTYSLKFILAGEVFSEAWRSLVAERVGSRNPCLDFASLYGTADAGVLGNETPLSIMIRRWLAKHPELIPDFFGEARLPTLVQYDPNSRYFEVEQDTLVFSGNNGVPLIRYHIADSGGIFTYQEMLARLRAYGFNPLQVLHKDFGGDRIESELPFVYVFGRSHFAVSYFGANIFPENVMEPLEVAPISDWVTGKFVMESVELEGGDRQLSIVVELAPRQVASLAKEQHIAQAIRDRLILVNSEFANYVPESYQIPKVNLLPSGNPDYFPVGIKHRYTR